ncbi:Optic atrophy 3-like protein [Kalmanozyma brasiliensis GHG001]|uniref:OPA3-domain-containing protein n=1 Tax=Kalmanozyma brasiliensis (strain GHG001) TaxID=1365824 RepID=V5E6K0_KALBG|nr:Optic atrophy 3-like protein [Kalmanozyma brasiliensis GHG001]EST05896.1 Optic atrophy 3-like protein [Kalmanozyma brasiliensis GHG001]
MATAKIATLAIRTLAKPIATQLKSQAAQHESFKKICIALAQRMHRTEMALRTNLLPNGVQQKVRPLNDAKAIANGANAISEGFLFFVAAALILGETYRGSRKKAEQRDRTEDSLNQLTDQVERLATVLGIDLEELQSLSEQDRDGSSRGCPQGSESIPGRREMEGDVTEEADPSSIEARLKVYRDRQDEDLKSKQLQAAVSVLLDLALKNRWVVGAEALELEGILGRTAAASPSSSSTAPEAPTAPGAAVQPQPYPATTSSADDSSQTLQPSIIQRVALERAKALAREVRGEVDASSQPADASLASLLTQHRQSTAA